MFPSWIQSWIIVLTNPLVKLYYPFPCGPEGVLIARETISLFRIREVIETFDDDVWCEYKIMSGFLKGKRFKIPNGGKKKIQECTNDIV